MPRKLKTYVASAGFFDQAIAAPSMKAALEAWGADRNMFQRGFAQETDDPAIVAATMAKPGVILKRAVGSKDPFTENAALPKSLPVTRPLDKAPVRPKENKAKERKTAKASGHKAANVTNLADARAAKEAAAAFERERARREKEDAKEEAARAKERERREEAVRKAEAILEKAAQRHDAAMAEIAEAREALDRRAKNENARWEQEKKKLDAGVRRAGSSL